MDRSRSRTPAPAPASDTPIREELGVEVHKVEHVVIDRAAFFLIVFAGPRLVCHGLNITIRGTNPDICWIRGVVGFAVWCFRVLPRPDCRWQPCSRRAHPSGSTPLRPATKVLRVLVLELHLLPGRHASRPRVLVVLVFAERVDQRARMRLLQKGAPVERAALDDEVIEGALLVRLAQERLLDRVLGDEAIDVDVADLPDAVRPVRG